MGRTIIRPEQPVAETAAAAAPRRRPGTGKAPKSLEQLLADIKAQCEDSIRFAAFEPNDPALWARVAAAVQAVLMPHWQAGILLGSTPEHGFFVRCDRTSHQEADLAVGRMRALVGVAPVKPAEFIIFALESATADSPVA